MLVDTHCHLYHERLRGDLDAVVARAREAGVAEILQPAIDIPSIHEALALCDRYEGVYAMAALHPTETQHATEAELEQIGSLCDDRRVVAVGESGLDYYWDRSYARKQADVLRFHARLASEKNLPLVLHNRDRQGDSGSSDDLVRILLEEQAASGAGQTLFGVFHCFGGSPEFAQQVLDLGFHLGIGGTLTYKNSGVGRSIADVPLDRVVLETDAPFLAPTPHRGNTNEPAHIRLIAEVLAAVKGMTVAEIAEATTGNARRLFNWNREASGITH